MDKMSLLIRPEWATMLSALPDADAGAIIKAFIRYAADGEVGDVPALHKAVLAMMCAVYEEDKRKYEEVCEKRKASASARWSKQADASECNSMQMDANADTCNDMHYNSNCNCNGNSKGNGNSNVLTDNTKEKGNTDVFPKEKPSTAQARRRVIEAWNAIAGVPKVSRLDAGTERCRMLTARIEAYGEDKVLEAIDHVSRSSFLQGATFFDFGWFVRPNNFPKVLEGKYDDKQAATDDRPRAWRVIDDMDFGEVEQ